MNFIKQIDRIKKIHFLICNEKTGNPDFFAKTLLLSRRQLYNKLEIIKNLDAPLKYCKKKESYYYSEPFYLELKYSLKTIVGNETREVLGGFII